VVAFDCHALAVPHANRVALAPKLIFLVARHLVSAHDRIVGLIDEDAEQHVAQAVILDDDARGGQRDPSMVAIRLDAAAAHLESAKHDARRG
jgi:hypothetical protein